MHLINDGLQVLMPLVTREELKEVHADKLQRELQDPLNNAKGTILNHGNNLIKVEQLNNDVEQSRQQRPFKMQNKEFNALVNAILEKKRAPEPKKIEVVQASSVPLTKAPRASLQTYLSFANNPANERKIIVDLQEGEIIAGKCVLAKQKGDDYIAVIRDDVTSSDLCKRREIKREEETSLHLFSKKQQEITDGFLAALEEKYGKKKVEYCFSKEDQEAILHHGISGGRMSDLFYKLEQLPLDQLYYDIQDLKEQVTMLGRAAMGVKGGLTNKRFADQAKLLQEKGTELRAKVEPFKTHFYKDIQYNARSCIRQLDPVIDEVSQIVEETQRNRNLVDGLGLEIKPSNGKPFSPQEGADIIADHEIGLTWKEVSDEEAKKRAEKSLVQDIKLASSKVQTEQMSDSESDVSTDVESDSVGSAQY